VAVGGGYWLRFERNTATLLRVVEAIGSDPSARLHITLDDPVSMNVFVGTPEARCGPACLPKPRRMTSVHVVA
jgi:hypothetical protein